MQTSTQVALERRRRISKALKARWKHRREKIQNGLTLPAQSTEPSPVDNIGDAAKAIIMAAQVLRAVSIGMKL